MGDFADLISKYLVGHSARSSTAGRCRSPAVWFFARGGRCDTAGCARTRCGTGCYLGTHLAVRLRVQNSVGESRGERFSAWISWAAWAGIIGPVLFTATFFAQEAFRRGEYHPLVEPVSALEAGPNGWIQQLNFAVFGLLTMAFAIGLDRGLRATRLSIAGPALLLHQRYRLAAGRGLPAACGRCRHHVRPPGRSCRRWRHGLPEQRTRADCPVAAAGTRQALAKHRGLHARGGDRCSGGFCGRRRPGGAGRRSTARLGRLVSALDRSCGDLSLPHCSLAQAAAGCERPTVVHTRGSAAVDTRWGLRPQTPRTLSMRAARVGRCARGQRRNQPRLARW
jgi:Protein of unknown function (DUF998)